MKFFGRSAVDMSGTILQAPRRLLGRVVAPAVLVALAVAGARHVGELVGERALGLAAPALAEAVALAVALEVPVADHPLEDRRERRGLDGQEADELDRGGRVGQPLGVHPVHRLQHVVADAAELELVHQPPPPFMSVRASRSIAATASLSGAWSSGARPARSASGMRSSKGTKPAISRSCSAASARTASSSRWSRTLLATSATRGMPRSRARCAIRRAVSSDLKYGSATSSMTSACSAVPRERCSGDASVSRMQTTSAFSAATSMTLRTVACMEHSQPVPAWRGLAMTSRLTPSGPSSECDEETSSSDSRRRFPWGVLTIRSAGSVGTASMRSAGMPRVSARFGLESASIASTLWPERARTRASVPLIDVLPDPPLPAIATFMTRSV